MFYQRVDLTFTPDSHPTPAELIIEPRDGNEAINMPIDEKTEVSGSMCFSNYPFFVFYGCLTIAMDDCARRCTSSRRRN